MTAGPIDTLYYKQYNISIDAIKYMKQLFHYFMHLVPLERHAGCTSMSTSKIPLEYKGTHPNTEGHTPMQRDSPQYRGTHPNNNKNNNK